MGGQNESLVKKYGHTHLYNPQGNMCCLGFYCNQLIGVPKKYMMKRSHPEDLANETSKWEESNEYAKKLVSVVQLQGEDTYVDNAFTHRAMDINDTFELTTEERENQIREHFLKEGIEVVFEGRYK
jgi:hypothetical protein